MNKHTMNKHKSSFTRGYTNLAVTLLLCLSFGNIAYSSTCHGGEVDSCMSIQDDKKTCNNKHIKYTHGTFPCKYIEDQSANLPTCVADLENPCPQT